MELPSKILQEIDHNTRPKLEEHLLIVMDKSTHQEHLSQLLQTNHERFKIAAIFLTGYNGIVDVTNSNNKTYFMNSVTSEVFFYSNYDTNRCF